MPALVKQLLHVCVTVPDVDEALTFYRDVLGFQSVFETRNDDADGPLLGFEREHISLHAHHILSVGADPATATQINLCEFTEPASVDGVPYEVMNHTGITRLALLVDSVDEAYAAVKDFPGVRVVCPPRGIEIREAEATFETRWMSFTDPYGVFITLTEPAA